MNVLRIGSSPCSSTRPDKMRLLKPFAVYSALSIYLITSVLSIRAQQPKNNPPTTQDQDVIRINTELLQAPVMVFDKSGAFVDGLQREQFELSVDGHPQQILFFEPITASSMGEAEKYERSRKGTTSVAVTGAVELAYGRTVIFFVDDLHLSTESVYRTRKALLHFIDSMGLNDRGMVTTTSGQIGFLQQLTDKKDVLRIAVERLNYRQLLAPDDRHPPMTPYQAFSIGAGDTQVIRYFVDMAMSDTLAKQLAQPAQLSGGRGIAEADAKGERVRSQAETDVKNRARGILEQHALISAMTLNVLRNFVGSLNQVSGSKLVFFISDGFFLNREIAGEIQKLNEITSGALKSGVVISSVQASGLNTTFNDASREVRLSPRGDTGAPSVGQDTAMQAPLYTLASDTGGSAFFNSNDMDRSIRHGLAETAKYYLLAWRPENAEQRAEAFRQLHARIKEHPEWTVRMQKGYFAAAPESRPLIEANENKSPGSLAANEEAIAEKMRTALSALYPIRSIPLMVDVTFLNLPQGEQLTVGTEVSLSHFFSENDGAQTGVLNLAGVVLNDEGKTVSSFGGLLRYTRDVALSGKQSVSHVAVMKEKPGLYQVRVAARDENTGLVGSAVDWILVPDLSARRFALSSLVVGAVATSPDQKARLNISHRFSRASRLRFLTYIYNAARGRDGRFPVNVSIQLTLLRDNQAVSTSPLTQVATEEVDDLTRIPYAGEISLHTLAPGRYALLLTATDNSAKASATERIRFVVE